jgi:predicted DNA-binding transcriptional regulator AlpA
MPATEAHRDRLLDRIDPVRSHDVPLGDIPRLLALIAAEQSRLSAAQASLAARLLAAEREQDRSEDDLLTAPQASAMLGMSIDWLYKTAGKLPFTRRIGPRSLRFSAKGIRRYLAHRRAP